MSDAVVKTIVATRSLWWGPRGITIVVSVVVHGALALAALTASDAKKKHEATTVSVLDEEKKKKVEPPKAPPPLPPPPPKTAPPPPSHVAKVEAAPPPETAPAPAPGPAEPVHSEQSFGNGDGTGPTIAHPETPVKPPPAPVKPPPRPVTHVDKPVAPPPVTEGGVCTEPPGKPEPTRKSEIEYTDEARAAGVEGRLVLKVTVDADGNVTKVEVTSSVDPQLDAAAIATVKTWHFKPAMACGKPVAGGTYTLARKFELSD